MEARAPSRTDVLTVEHQMAEYIDGRGRSDAGFRVRLQRFLQGEGASFDLPVDADAPMFAAPALDADLRAGRMFPRSARRLARRRTGP